MTTTLSSVRFHVPSQQTIRRFIFTATLIEATRASKACRTNSVGTR